MRQIISRTVVIFALLCTQWLVGQTAVKKMTNQDVVDLVTLGLSDDVVMDKIHAVEATDFDTSLPALKSLKQANVSDTVIRAMINPHPDSAGDSNPPAKAADPNDPNSPHDPGIYMYAKGPSGAQMTMLEPTVYTQGKSGGVFASAMTYGIAKMKWKAVVRGAHANTKSNDASMVFYFYFEEMNAGLSHASFGGTSTPNEFTLVKFDVKGDSRETVTMKLNAFGASSGTDEKANTGFSFTKLRPGVYKVVPNEPLKAGEYCFLSSSGMGSFGAGAAGASRLFDFRVE